MWALRSLKDLPQSGKGQWFLGSEEAEESGEEGEGEVMLARRPGGYG
jgi:hypothetical protein